MTASPAARRIDVHHHFVPPSWLSARGREIQAAINSPSTTLENWTPAADVESMDRHGVARAYLSMTSPGIWFGNGAEACRLGRSCNDYGAELIRRHRPRFGLFAVLPLPDVDGSLREIEYAFDQLNADGVGILTSYGGSWLGDRAFDPVLQELNRRKCVAFVHPTSPASCCSVDGMPPSLFEFPFDTTRTIASLAFSGALRRYPSIRWIFCHGGGALPMLAGRFASNSYARGDAVRRRTGDDIAGQLRRLWFDVVAATNRPAMAALTALLPETQLLFGTDAPFIRPERTIAQLADLGLPVTTLHRIESDNAHDLFRTLKVPS